MNLDLLEELCLTPGPPGHEDRIRAVARGHLAPISDDLSVDPVGNLVAHRAGPGPRLMLAAHLDEIGFMVKAITPGGFLPVLPLGGFDPKTLTAQRVVVHGREDLLGVMGAKPIHLMSEADRRRPSKLEDFTVDLGLPAERVMELVRPGDPVTRERTMERMGDLVTCKSLDNRAGLYVMIEALRALGDHSCDVWAVATVQEEVGLRGARVAAGRLRPRLGLAIDITLANDGPDAAAHDHITDLGAGAGIKVYDAGTIVPPRVVEHLLGLARERAIPHQLEVMRRGSSDTREVQQAGDGALAGAVSIPTRYVHQVVECCHPDDLDACVALVAAFCETAHELLESA